LTGSLRELFRIRRLLVNLIILTIILTSVSFNYFLISFDLKNLPGNIYLNAIVSSIFEIIFIFLSLSILNKIGLKRSLVLGFLLSLCGAIPLILIKNKPQATPVFILLARVGITFNMNICYLSFAILFPPVLSHSAFGFAKFLARFATILAPMAAELKAPTPMGVFSFMSLIAANTACFLKSKKKIKRISELD
jgi:OCT family organic cation transporter-like MFS transporter 4/5